MDSSQPHLFRPLRLRELTLPNRVVVSPMCQYSAVDGRAGDWHLMHLGNLAVGGAGMLIVEMTAVRPEGRITPNCLGLYDAACEDALGRVLEFCRTHSDMPVALQLAHSGRKASTRPPWQESAPLTPDAGGWQPLAPSALAAGAGSPAPRALEADELGDLQEAFVTATRRAAGLGFDAVEIHMAHGYLLHQFLSPLSNRRDDGYGGSYVERMRFPLEVFAAMRAAWPRERPLGVRISATDWVGGGWDMPQSLALVTALEGLGCDWVDVSSGGLVATQEIPVGPAYQVPFAAEIREATDMAVMAVGMITGPQQAEGIVSAGQADLVALGRGMLYNPRWAWHAAHALGADVPYPPQYLRCRP